MLSFQRPRGQKWGRCGERTCTWLRDTLLHAMCLTWSMGGFHTAQDRTSSRASGPLTSAETRCASTTGFATGGPADRCAIWFPPPHHVAQPEGLLQLARQNTPPQRIVQAEQSVINSWPRKHRQIFALVDGKRSVRHIATILKLSPADVEVVVNDLQSLGVIRK